MYSDRYLAQIDELLRQIAKLERDLAATADTTHRYRVERNLKTRYKRFEFLIPYKYRRELDNICREAGISTQFV
ncbi:MAG: hypothetical protein AAFV07_00525 [Bacteroidota bacterium]